MIIQILSCLLSCLGYYFIQNKPKLAYLTFILLNIILFFSTKQYVMLFNIIFSSYFLIKTYRNGNKRRILDDLL
jgi:type II secretory pathway component PulF